MRRTLVIGALLAVAAPLLVLGPSTPEPAYALPGDQGIGWQYHDESRSYYQDPVSAPGDSGPARRPTRYVDWGEGDMALYQCPTEYDGSPFECTGNNPAGTFCNDLPGENGRPVAPRVIFEREFENPVTQEGNPPWRPLEPEDGDAEHYTPYCQELPEDHVVTPVEIQNDVDYDVFQDLTGLEINMHPNNRTLVNLSTIFYTRYPEGVDQIAEVEELDADRDPKPYIRIRGEVEGKVAPFEYMIEAEADINWDFGNGIPDKAQGRGRPYDGTLPQDASAGHYVTTQFRKAEASNVSLGAEWNGQVTVETPGGPETQDIEPVVIDPVNDQVQVSEATSVITD